MSSVMWDGPELARLYDRISDLQFRGGRRLAEMTGVGNGEAVLDVGCGTGRLAVHLADLVGPMGRVAGIDPSPYRVSVAEEKRKLAARRNLRITLGQGEDLGAFSDREFDHVIYSSVIHWIKDKSAALMEAYRVLRAGGNVGINTVDRNQHFAMKKVMDDIIVGRHPEYRAVEDEMARQLVDKGELERLLAEAGFREVRIDVVPEKHCYASTKELFDFIEASSFGNFLRGVPDRARPGIMEDMGRELEKMRTPNGIELSADMLYATAAKPR